MPIGFEIAPPSDTSPMKEWAAWLLSASAAVLHINSDLVLLVAHANRLAEHPKVAAHAEARGALAGLIERLSVAQLKGAAAGQQMATGIQATTRHVASATRMPADIAARFRELAEASEQATAAGELDDLRATLLRLEAAVQA